MEETIHSRQNKVTEIKRGMLVRELPSWNDFVDFVKDPTASCATLIYRGQGNANWPVTSTLDRLEQRFPTTPDREKDNGDYDKWPRVDRVRQLERFKEMARGRLRSEISRIEEDEWWALAQHHGMATPMLDWTYSPFVALYFAFEKERCIHRAPRNRAIFALAHHLIPAQKNDSTSQTQKHPKPFAPSWPGNYRLTNQGGLFLKMPQGVDLERYVKSQFRKESYSPPRAGGKGNLHPLGVLEKFIIPNDEKSRFECLRFLDHMNINRASLFPDLDGAARYVNDLWEVNWDKAIGYINDTACRPSSGADG